MRKLTLLFFAAFLSACGTMPIPSLTEAAGPPKIEPAPADRVLAFQERPAGPSGTVVVTRASAFTGAACLQAVFINGKLAARLASGETAKFQVPAGDVAFISGHDPMGAGICAPGNSNQAQTKLNLREGETRYFRLSLEHAAPVIVQR